MIAVTQPAFTFVREQPDISVLIIGGGVNGAGLLRELALQGVDCLLVEKSDFCSGTSAAGTRMIHGGLRYLENAELRLVRESLRERNLLLKNAPHYVRPLATTIPIFDWTSGIVTATRGILGFPSTPGRRGALLVKAGLLLYDWFSGRKSPVPRHRFRSARSALALRPLLDPRVVATATYFDASVNCPERLCLELILDAENISPQAAALNYASVQGARGPAVILRDEITGENAEVRPHIVVNASGPWIDLTNRALGRPSHFIGGTKGSHVVLDHPQLLEATRGEMIYFANRDGRICIFYPFGDKVIAGSTDIPTDDADAVCDDEEVAYLLESIRLVFPGIRVDRSHVVFRFCGVRPLPRSNARAPGQISRDHSHPLLSPGDGLAFPVYSLVGGKWTTFRAFAEQIADEILRVLGRRRIRGSRDLAIGGGREFHASAQARTAFLDRLHQRTGLTPARLEQLLERYGTRAVEIADYLAGGSDALLQHHPGYSSREIQFFASRERVRRLDDVILRRTLIGLLGESTRSLLEEIAALLAPPLGWTTGQTVAEVERTAHMLVSVHGVMPQQLNR